MLSAAFLLLAAAASPDPEDELALAVKLAQRGWIDLAEELCEKVRTDARASEKARANAPLAAAEVAVEKARREGRAGAIARDLDGPIALLKAHADASLEHRVTLGWVLSEKGRLLALFAELEEDAAERNTIAAQASGALAACEEFERALIEDLKKKPSTPDVESALLDARFELPKAQLARARLAPPADSLRAPILRQAMDGFIDLQYDTQPPLSWEAQLHEGRCLLELGLFAKAEAKLQGIVELRKLAPPGKAPEALIHQAMIPFAQALTRGGKPAQAIAMADAFVRQNPALAKAAIGLALQLEKADALHVTKNDPQAFALAVAVEKADPAGALGKTARNRIRSWVGDGKGAPELWMLLADADLAQGRAREALVSLRKCVEACVTAAEKAAHEPAALFKQGEAHRSLGRDPEAVAAFEQVFRRWPGHPLAAKAGVEAARSLAREAATSGDPRDRERLEKFLVEVEKAGAGGDSVRFLHATLLEGQGRLAEAADLFDGVGEDSEYFAQAMISSAHCRRRDAAKKPKEQLEIPLKAAEKTLRRFQAWGETHSVPPKLAAIASRELTTVLLSQGRTKDALAEIERIPAAEQDAEARLQKLDLQVRVQLAEKRLDEASASVDAMLKEKPDAAVSVRACRSVFRALDQEAATTSDPAALRELARKSVAYAGHWVERAEQLGKPSTAERVEAADSIYQGARRLNGLGEGVMSFLDLGGRKLDDRASLLRAADALRRILAAKPEDLSAKDRLLVQSRLAHCAGFVAVDVKGWEAAKSEYDAIVREYKMVGARGLLDTAVLQAQPGLLSLYIELGSVYAELARRGQAFQYDNAAQVWGNTIRVTAPGSEPWWRAKYQVIAMLLERGQESDVRDARVLLENTERNNPDFDGDRFGFKTKFLALREAIRKLTGK